MAGRICSPLDLIVSGSAPKSDALALNLNALQYIRLPRP